MIRLSEATRRSGSPEGLRFQLRVAACVLTGSSGKNLSRSRAEVLGRGESGAQDSSFPFGIEVWAMADAMGVTVSGDLGRW